MPSFFGKLEHFAADWDALRQEVPALGTVPHINKAAFDMDFIRAYDQRSLELAVARFARDFTLFDYSLPPQAGNR